MFYNLYLSIKYDAHINTKIYTDVKTYKCIFKFIYKNNDYINFRTKRVNENEIMNLINKT